MLSEEFYSMDNGHVYQIYRSYRSPRNMGRTLIWEKMFERAKYPLYIILTTHRLFLSIPMTLFIFLPMYSRVNVMIAHLLQ